jgi:glycosyltransferase involved in cell wall biosynthesis
MKKIAMIVTDVALAGEKGLGRMFYLAELFCQYGYEVDLITSKFQHWLKKFRTEEEMETIRQKAKCNITFVDEDGYTKNVQVKRILSRRGLTKRIKAHLEANTYDLVYSQIPDNHLASVAAAYAKKKGIPFVVDIEDLWPEAMRMVLDVPVVSDILFSYFTVTAKKTYKLADAAVGSSDTYRDEPLKYKVKIPRSVTVYVGNELSAFDEEAAANLSKVEKPEGEFWVTYAGTLGTSYDIATLIRAADILEKRGVEGLRVVLLGDGPLRGDFEALAKELSGKVSFIGYVPHALMAAYLVKSDVTVNSLVRKAAQSIVSKIGDYLASGHPMINTGLDPEFWGKVEADGFGVNVEPEDPEALANVIEGLMKDPSKCEQMGITARKIGEEQFDRPRSYKKIIDMVDALLNIHR